MIPSTIIIFLTYLFGLKLISAFVSYVLIILIFNLLAELLCEIKKEKITTI